MNEELSREELYLVLIKNFHDDVWHCLTVLSRLTLPASQQHQRFDEGFSLARKRAPIAHAREMSQELIGQLGFLGSTADHHLSRSQPGEKGMRRRVPLLLQGPKRLLSGLVVGKGLGLPLSHHLGPYLILLLAPRRGEHVENAPGPPVGVRIATLGPGSDQALRLPAYPLRDNGGQVE